jgi:hypothetical protein
MRKTKLKQKSEKKKLRDKIGALHLQALRLERGDVYKAENGRFCMLGKNGDKARRIYGDIKKCMTCGETFFARYRNNRPRVFCSKKCLKYLENRKPKICGEHIVRNGYHARKILSHPFADRQGYVRLHRVVMEMKIGRYLQPYEVVHHINGDKTDNRIENLLLCANETEHQKYHNPKGAKIGQKRN